MKFIFPILLLFILLACKDEPKALSEDFLAIGYDGRDHEITLSDSMSFEAPKLKFILFLYHDSIFKVEIDSQNKQSYSLLKGSTQSRDTLLSLFNSYQKTTLQSQLKNIKEHGIKHGCYTDGYFLFDLHGKIQFGLFEFTKFYDWRTHFPIKEIRLNPRQFPKIYETIYHMFNSKWWDYYMSNEYHYK